MGKRFCPRIKGLHSQWIYRINRDRDYGPLTPLVGRGDRTINLQWIEDSWDRIGHFFASLEAGHSTASVALKRIVSYGPKNEFYRGAIEAAKVFKTEFILDLLQDPTLRRRQRRGLLKGEQLNSLARNVFYGKRGRADWRDLHRQMCSASCLTVVLACIIYWQIKEMERVLGEHDPGGAGIDVSMLEHVSPIGWDNVILYGQYHLNQKLVRGQPSIEELMEARESSAAQRSRP